MLKKKKIEAVDENAHILPYIQFTLLDGNGALKIEVKWPTEDGFNRETFSELLSLIVNGKFRKDAIEKSVHKFADANKQSENAKTILEVLNKKTEEIKSKDSPPPKVKEIRPLIPADKVTHTHFSQQNTTVQSEE